MYCTFLMLCFCINHDVAYRTRNFRWLRSQHPVMLFIYKPKAVNYSHLSKIVGICPRPLERKSHLLFLLIGFIVLHPPSFWKLSGCIVVMYCCQDRRHYKLCTRHLLSHCLYDQSASHVRHNMMSLYEISLRCHHITICVSLMLMPLANFHVLLGIWHICHKIIL